MYLKMHVIYLILLFACLAKNSLCDTELPATIKICGRNDANSVDCLRTAIAEAVRLFEIGIPEKQINSIEPLDVGSFEIKHNQGSFNLNQSYKNCHINGLSTIVLKDIKKLPNTMCDYKMKAFVPKVDFICDYVVEGKLLLFVTKGFGKSNITLIDTNLKIDGACDDYENNNKTYVKITKMDFDLKPKKIIFVFDNLFDGNEELSKTLNTVINENANALYAEYGAQYRKILSSKFLEIAQKFIQDVPKEKVFLN